MRWPGKRWFITSYAAASLLLQSLVPFYAVYQAPSLDAPHMASLFGDKVLICSSEGFRLVSWEELLKGGGQRLPDEHHAKYQCALCYVAAHGTGIGPAQVAIAAARWATCRGQAFAYRIFSATDHGWRRFLTRAPPGSFAG